MASLDEVNSRQTALQQGTIDLAGHEAHEASGDLKLVIDKTFYTYKLEEVKESDNMVLSAPNSPRSDEEVEKPVLANLHKVQKRLDKDGNRYTQKEMMHRHGPIKGLQQFRQCKASCTYCSGAKRYGGRVLNFPELQREVGRERAKRIWKNSKRFPNVEMSKLTDAEQKEHAALVPDTCPHVNAQCPCSTHPCGKQPCVHHAHGLCSRGDKCPLCHCSDGAACQGCQRIARANQSEWYSSYSGYGMQLQPSEDVNATQMCWYRETGGFPTNPGVYPGSAPVMFNGYVAVPVLVQAPVGSMPMMPMMPFAVGIQ